MSDFLCYNCSMKALLYVPPLKLQYAADESVHSYQSDNLLIILNLKGRTRVAVNNVSYSLAAGDVLVVNPREICTVYRSDSALFLLTIERSWLKLNAEDASAYFMCNSTQYKNKARFAAIESAIIAAAENRTAMTQTRAMAIAYDIYDELLKKFTVITPAARNNNTKIADIIAYIEQNYSENLLLNDIAEKFNLSVPYLSKMFKDSTGMTFADFYDDIRINHSLYDLLDTQQTIIDISYKHGFPNNHAYIRAFKKITGMLPTEARKKKRAEAGGDADEDRELAGMLAAIERDNAQNEGVKDYYITESYAVKPMFTLEGLPSQEVLCVGPATVVLHKNVQDIIQILQKQKPFRYAYLRGIFSDELSFCTRGGADGRLSFKFSMIDEVLDFLLAQNLTPAVSLTYMPQALAKGNTDTVFDDGYYICGPSDLAEWRLAVSTFTDHVISRYGMANVQKWLFIPWVQLDSKNRHIGFADEDEFFEFYKASHTALKEKSPLFTVTSPEIYPSAEDNGWLEQFLARAERENCFPDALALKFSANSHWEVIEVDEGKKARRKVIHDEISPDEDLLKKALDAVRTLLARKGYSLDLYVTSFNFTITDTHPLLDTLFAASYYAKNYVDNIGTVKSLGYWKLCDATETSSLKEIFTGMPGMYLSNVIPKSTGQALRMLSFTKTVVLDKGENYLFTTIPDGDNYFHLFAFNYIHPTHLTAEDYPEKNDPYSAFVEKDKMRIRFRLNDLPYTTATIRSYALNYEHGAVYDKWKDMGMPDLDFYSDRNSSLFAIFFASSIPDFKTYSLDIKDGTLTLDLELEPFAIQAIEIYLG